ncbi:helix-turn-helix domain-containing protein [Halocatena halophila]|uniref:helix-turn-helix domain-containing protein n=1 Tax=Halocatena halophila TaxID=2814576 RepID=UPI0038B33653
MEAVLEALKAAIEGGYFDDSRSASLSTVADALGCTTATAYTHLRKAERTVILAAIGSSRRC